MIFFLKSYKYYRILTYVVHFMVIILIIKLIVNTTIDFFCKSNLNPRISYMLLNSFIE